MTNVSCTRCKETRAPVPFRPFQNERGQRVVDQICNVCWSEWLKLQQQLINHYGLNVRDQSSKDFLYRQLDEFLFTNAPQS
jgi:Fe-S cluster biosynthesis and repair protein YggX